MNPWHRKLADCQDFAYSIPAKGRAAGNELALATGFIPCRRRASYLAPGFLPFNSMR
jgi:hypothetical protein